MVLVCWRGGGGFVQFQNNRTKIDRHTTSGRIQHNYPAPKLSRIYDLVCRGHSAPNSSALTSTFCSNLNQRRCIGSERIRAQIADRPLNAINMFPIHASQPGRHPNRHRPSNVSHRASPQARQPPPKVGPALHCLFPKSLILVAEFSHA